LENRTKHDQDRENIEIEDIVIEVEIWG